MVVSIPDFDSVLTEARFRKSQGDEFAANVEYWLSNLGSKPKIEKMRNLSEREKVCANCSHSSKALQWCCVNKNQLNSISEMVSPPNICPYLLELVILGEKITLTSEEKL